MVRHAAALVDNVAYSSDFRCECLDVLNELVAGLKDAAAPDDEGEDAE
jgi:hypothetical protein